MRKTLAAVAAAAALLASPGAVAQTELKFASFPPAPGALNKDVLEPWVQEVNEALQGVVNVRLFTGGALGRDPAQQYKLVRDRVAEIGYIVMGYTPGEFPDSTIFELPFLVETSLEGSLGHWRMYERGLLRGYDNIRLLGAFTIPAQSLHTSFPIKSVDDLKGRKIRSAGPYQSAALERLGATPVSGIPIPGVAEAVSRGVVDGTLSDWNGMIAFRLAAVTKFHLEVPLGAAAAGIVMNHDAYNSLPQKAREVIDRLSGEALSRKHGEEFDDRYKANFERTKGEAGRTFIIPNEAERDEMKQRLQPVVDRWIEQNPDGRKRYDALVGIVDEIRQGR